MKTCGICSHPERTAIDAALVDRTPLRSISGRYGTSRSALDRHRGHLALALTQAKKAEEVADATTLLSRIERLMSRCDEIYEKAMKGGELAGAVGATRELRQCLELLGKLSGELKQPGVNVGIKTSFANLSIKDFTDQQLRELCDLVIAESDLDDEDGAPSKTIQGVR